MIKRGKKAQFYLIAAIVIAMIVFGFVAVKNYAVPEQKKTVVFDLASVLPYEAGKVMDYSFFEGKDLDDTLKNFAETIAENQIESEVDNWFIIYGDKDKMTVLTFIKESTGTVEIDYGGTNPIIFSATQVSMEMTEKLNVGDSVIITFQGIDYEFDIQKGKNFAFLIKQGENIATNANENKE